MKPATHLFAAFVAALSITAACQPATHDETVVADFQARQSELAQCGALGVFDAPLSAAERQCLQMLYAYMPLPDATDRTGEYYLEKVVRPALQARAEMPWGDSVPQLLFRHFVLPVRVNNESLDEHRPLFYAQLKERVAGLSMKEAILEVNHWCHEKVTYEPSDGRTHSPLQSVSSAIGRCGEESTFAVAALRAVGIPARQVYTPRWAHTDDNHAWVEAWADGQWHFLGACEPEPVLNLGWFNAPASRGMLMHARVFGRYQGQEELLDYQGGVTVVNVTSNYAPTAPISVQVIDSLGQPVEGANVSFRLYNYAEFYPIATRISDAQGRASLEAGLGDLLLWATHGQRFGLAKCSVGRDSLVTLKLDKDATSEFEMELNLTPPAEGDTRVEVSPQMRACNTQRMAAEDSVRQAYMATFSADTSTLLRQARGNHATISRFLKAAGEDRQKAIELLGSLTEKDLTDVSLPVLLDHLAAVPSGGGLFAQYVMSPRIWREELTPWRASLNVDLGPQLAIAARRNPQVWVDWVKEHIDASLTWYPAQVTMSPQSVMRVRRTSAQSRDIFFVAGARSMGIPARINSVTGRTQWADWHEDWHDVDWHEAAVAAPTAQGSLALAFQPTPSVPEAKYAAHFSLSHILQGEPQLLQYPDFAPATQLFGQPQPLAAGQYMLVTGQRMASGGVLARLSVMQVPQGQVTRHPLSLRYDREQLLVLGSLDAESRFLPAQANAQASLLSHTGRGYYILGLVRPGHEPSNHALRDVARAAEQIQQTGRHTVILFPSPSDVDKTPSELLPTGPAITLGSDPTGRIAQALAEGLNQEQITWPTFVVADTFGRIVYMSQGYTIGLGDALLSALRRAQGE